MTAETASKSSSGSSAKSGGDLHTQLKRELITFTGVAAETTPERLRRNSAGSPSMIVSDERAADPQAHQGPNRHTSSERFRG